MILQKEFLMSRIRLTRVLFIATWIALALLPAGLGWFLITGGLSRETLLAQVPDVAVSPELSNEMILFAAAPGLLSIGLAMFVLWQMQALFRTIDRGDALSYHAAFRVKRIGLGMLVLAVAGPVLRPFQILILTSANPPGERVLAIGFSSSDMSL